LSPYLILQQTQSKQIKNLSYLGVDVVQQGIFVTFECFELGDALGLFLLQRGNLRHRYIGSLFVGIQGFVSDMYGVATINRLLEIIGLFCKRAL